MDFKTIVLTHTSKKGEEMPWRLHFFSSRSGNYFICTAYLYLAGSPIQTEYQRSTVSLESSVLHSIVEFLKVRDLTDDLVLTLNKLHREFEYSTFARTKRSAPNFITLSDETQKDLRSGF